MIELREAAVVVPSEQGTTTVLHPTTVTLTEQRISIIGANGSGKSTLARLINGLALPSSGSVTITPGSGLSENMVDREPARSTAPDSSPALDTRPLDTVRDGAAVRRAVGFVFTNPDAQLIMPTAAEDVELSLRRSHPKKPERQAAARAALARFGIEHLAERSVHALSGGQKQLLAIASVLATDPAILVADEPTTLLDLSNALMISDLLMSLPQQTVVVTHDLDLAARADRTLVIDGGRIAFDGEPREVIAAYRELASESSRAPQ